MPTPRRVLAAAVAAAAALPLAGCAAAGPGGPGAAAVVVRVAPSAEPVEVHLAEADGGFRSVHRMRAGETRRFAVPAGWVTVRIPGRCVVPADNRGTAVVEVGRAACRLV